MRDTLEDFTEAERAIINDMHRREFADLTPDEAMLWGEWNAVLGKIDADIAARNAALNAKVQADIESHSATEQAAQDALKALADLARAKLRSIENGQA